MKNFAGAHAGKSSPFIVDMDKEVFSVTLTNQTASLQWLTTTPRFRITIPPCCALCKQGQRFLTSIATSKDDDSATHRLRKFVKSSSKHVALNTLSHLLSPTTTTATDRPPHLSSLVLPFYLMITEASWFSWNAKLVADVIAAMYKQERFSEAERLMEETVERTVVQKRDLCNFYCCVIDSTAKHQLKEELLSCLSRLREVVTAPSSTSVHVRKRAYESMIKGLCEIGMPCEAEHLMGEMVGMGLKPSGFQLKSLVYAYGRLGLFEDMKRNVVEMGEEVDTVCCNMVLSALGDHNDLSEMVAWLQRMKVSQVPFSSRTYNSVLNSCPTIMSMVQDPTTVPLSITELIGKLPRDEANVVVELVGPSSVVDSVMEWKASELKLDLHGLHLSASFLIFLQWIEELQRRFSFPGSGVITVVCGSGKHSVTRGVSPVKGLLKEMIIRMKCPLKIDRKNTGCFVAKGKVFRDWLLIC